MDDSPYRIKAGHEMCLPIHPRLGGHRPYSAFGTCHGCGCDVRSEVCRPLRLKGYEKLPASGRLVLVGPRGGKYVRTEKRGSKHYEKEG